MQHNTYNNNAPLRIAIAGIGTVGSATIDIIQQHADVLAARSGRAIEITAISARDRNKNRGIDLSKYRWENNPIALTTAPDIDLIIETIGGQDIAKELTISALKQKKHVVTANKALLAHHGVELARIAENNNVVLAFEAAVAGGIPIIKTIREALVGNSIKKVIGILNGTSNFILTHMQNHQSSFEQALSQASELGYAEADPSLDVDGFDAAQKLSLVTALAFGCKPDYNNIYVEGIRNISRVDMQCAAELGYNIKLLGISTCSSAGNISQRVHPCMIPINSPIGVDDVYNAIVIEGSHSGYITLEGRGAGGGPTASAIISDICDIARGTNYPAFTIPTAQLQDACFLPIDNLNSAYYMRLSVLDQPGVLAEITNIFAQEEISVQSFLQRSHQPEQAVQLILTTHITTEAAMQRATHKISELSAIAEPPHIIRIEEFAASAYHV